MTKIFLLVCVIVGSFNGVSHAQNPQSQSKEEIVLITYYPVPYGDYQYLRLMPTDPLKTCDDTAIGTITYSSQQNQVVMCRLNESNSPEWVPISLWSQSGNNLYSTHSQWNVGIGTSNPQAKLDVEGPIMAGTGSSKGRVIHQPCTVRTAWHPTPAQCLADEQIVGGTCNCASNWSLPSGAGYPNTVGNNFTCSGYCTWASWGWNLATQASAICCKVD